MKPFLKKTTCKHCDNTIPAKVLFCKYCGRSRGNNKFLRLKRWEWLSINIFIVTACVFIMFGGAILAYISNEIFPTHEASISSPTSTINTPPTESPTSFTVTNTPIIKSSLTPTTKISTPKPTSTNRIPTATPKPITSNDHILFQEKNPIIDRYSIKILEFDNKINSSDWDRTNNVSISNNEIIISGTGDYDTYISRNSTDLDVGEGIVVFFSYSANTQSEIYISNKGNRNYTWGIYILPGPWGQDTPFGYNYFDGTNHYFGEIDHNTLVGKANVEFGLFLGIEEDGDLIIIIWKVNAPKKYFVYKQSHPNWPMNNWDLIIQGKAGKLIVHSYTLIDISQ